MDVTPKIGMRIKLNANINSVPYIVSRSWYTNMYIGKRGTIIGFADTGKIAIQFDDIVFTKYKEKMSSHDNGCHGKGKLHYCWYIPLSCIEQDTINLLLLL